MYYISATFTTDIFIILRVLLQPEYTTKVATAHLPYMAVAKLIFGTVTAASLPVNYLPSSPLCSGYRYVPRYKLRIRSPPLRYSSKSVLCAVCPRVTIFNGDVTVLAISRMMLADDSGGFMILDRTWRFTSLAKTGQPCSTCQGFYGGLQTQKY
ncbi:hypothetical protein BC629DRAFT_1436761 [Irpex lacteus]|nr:hypothetical protein BC629DRAFT_1436761 [Irpex lacteus]